MKMEWILGGKAEGSSPERGRQKTEGRAETDRWGGAVDWGRAAREGRTAHPRAERMVQEGFHTVHQGMLTFNTKL